MFYKKAENRADSKNEVEIPGAAKKNLRRPAFFVFGATCKITFCRTLKKNIRSGSGAPPGPVNCLGIVLKLSTKNLHGRLLISIAQSTASSTNPPKQLH